MRAPTLGSGVRSPGRPQGRLRSHVSTVRTRVRGCGEEDGSSELRRDVRRDAPRGVRLGGPGRSRRARRAARTTVRAGVARAGSRRTVHEAFERLHRPRPPRRRRRGRGAEGARALPQRRHGGGRWPGLRRGRRLPRRPRRLLHRHPGGGAPLASSTTPDQTLAAAADQAHAASDERHGLGCAGLGLPDVAVRLADPGHRTAAVARLEQRQRRGPPSAVTLADLPGGATSGLGSGTGLGSGCSDRPTSELGLSCLLDTVTVALGNLGTAAERPHGAAGRSRALLTAS